MNGTDLDDNVKDLLNTGSMGFDYLKSSNLRQTFNSPQLISDILFLKNNQLIDAFEYSFLINFLPELENINSFEDLMFKTNYYINQWENQGYLEGTKSGDISGVILAITKRSTEWWLENEDQVGLQTNQKAVPWLALDAAGAIVSGVLAGVAEYQLTGECCSDTWGVAVVGGAVVASTGLVGKVGRFIAWAWP